MTDINLKDVLRALSDLRDDGTVPRNVKLHLDAAETQLKSQAEVSIRVNQALNELEEIADDTNLQPWTRTQLLNIVSMLEKVH